MAGSDKRRGSQHDGEDASESHDFNIGRPNCSRDAPAANGVYAVWSTASGVRALEPGKTEPVALAPNGAFPNVVALPGGRALAAWENSGTIQMQALP